MKIQVKLFIILFSIFVFSACQDSITTQPELLQQTEVSNVDQLKNDIIKVIVDEVNPKDSLFIVTKQIVGICGNDRRFNGELTNEEIEAERKARIEYIKQNPYFIENPTEFDTFYQFNDKTVICGSYFQNTFEYDSISFSLDRQNKLVYMFDFVKVKKDTVQAVYRQYLEPIEVENNITMILKDSIWVKL